MTKILECGVIVPGCKFVVHGEDEEELMMKAIEHVRATHDIERISEQLKARIRAAIEEE